MNTGAREVAKLAGASLVLALAAVLGTQTFRSPPAESPPHHHSGLHMAADAGSTGPAPAARPATVVKPISCEKLADVPGKAVTTAIVAFPPNARSGPHRHPGSVTAVVLHGAIRSQLEGAKATTYRAGETWFEPTGALHLLAENASATVPAELVAFFVADVDCGPLVVPEPGMQ